MVSFFEHQLIVPPKGMPILALYLGLMDDKTTVDCFFEYQLIGPQEAMSISALTSTLTLALVYVLALILPWL